MPGRRRAGSTQLIPVSAFQERLWILQRLEPASCVYNKIALWRNSGGAAATKVAGAIRSLLERHEILRCVFDEVDGQLAAWTLPAEALPVAIRDLSALGSHEQHERMVGDMKAEAATPFDLTSSVPTRFYVYRLGDAETATLVAAHHIAIDDESLVLLRKELTAACVSEEPAAARQLQYADYVAHQHGRGSPAAIAADLEWWAGFMAGAPTLSVFPPDLAAAGGLSWLRAPRATRIVEWGPDLAAAVSALVENQGATLPMMMVAACTAVLCWYTGQERYVFGHPTGARKGAELESLIGPFVDTLLVCVDATSDPTFTELLGRVRTSMLAANEHRVAPFEAILQRLKPERHPTHSPLFQIALVHADAPRDALGMLREAGGAQHELTWSVCETRDGEDSRPGGLECAFEYRPDLYSAAAIDRIATHLEIVCRRATQDSSRRLSELVALSPPELAQLQRFNQTAVAFPKDLFITEFERVAERQPDRVALTCGSTEITFGELDRRADQFARVLRATGVTRGVRVALCLERSPLLLITLLGIQKAGGTYVPLDSVFPARRLEFMLSDSRAVVLVVDNEAATNIQIPERAVVVNAAALPMDQGHGARLPLEARPEDAAYVLYTSGSTGQPKGVAVSHGALMNLLRSMAREPGLSAADVLAAITTISFDIAGLELYLPLLVGARIELVPEIEGGGPGLASLLNDRGVTVMQATPAIWRLLVEADWRGPPGFRALCGGEALPPDLAESLLGRVSELWNLYGPTETTIWSCADRVETCTRITIGRPISNTQVYVVGKSGGLQPIGVPGEIWIGGAGVALGYVGRPELTGARFVADRFGADATKCLYRTGDRGRWCEDGRLEYLGRLDHQVKIRGVRIETGEVEAILATLQGVQQAVVVAHDAGPADRRLVAYVVYQPGADVTASDIRRYLRDRLPPYLVPSLVVAIDAIPLTPNGKVDRAALPDPFGSAAATAQYEPPRTRLELLLAGIWSEVLKVDRVGLHDNFFDLGGHSLLSLRVAAEVAASTGWRMDPRILFFQNLGQIAAAGSQA